MRWQSLPGAEGVRLCTRAVSPFADALIVVSEGMQRRIPGIVIPCGVRRRTQAGAPCEEIYLARALVERPGRRRGVAAQTNAVVVGGGLGIGSLARQGAS